MLIFFRNHFLGYWLFESDAYLSMHAQLTIKSDFDFTQCNSKQYFLSSVSASLSTSDLYLIQARAQKPTFRDNAIHNTSMILGSLT